jgi:amidase
MSSTGWTLPNDPLGAFCRDNHVALAGSGKGPLAGLTFAGKDLFHIKGHRTGFGHPDWLRTHPPAKRTAAAVKRLLAAGADMVGRTHCDELCYSLTGENVHYGAPVNVNARGRIPGGSSNGSAAAVAGKLVDFAIGSDCGGSVRIPASYCGILGMRPTWGRVSLDGAVPFGPSFDVAGWFARDAALFEKVGRVLLADRKKAGKPKRLLVARDAFSLLEPAVAKALRPAVSRLEALIGKGEEVEVAPDGLVAWFETFRTIQAAEVWASVGAWVSKVEPRLGPGVKERIAWAATVTPQMHAEASARRAEIVARMQRLVGPDDVLCLPTSPRAAPLLGTPVDKIEIEYRNQAMCLLCIAGLAGLPQLTLPLAHIDGLPLGLSIVGRRGADTMLLSLATRT